MRHLFLFIFFCNYALFHCKPLFIHMFIHMYTYVYVYICSYIGIHMCMYTYVHTYVYLYICSYICIHMCIYTYVHTYVFICVFIHMFGHTNDVCASSIWCSQHANTINWHTTHAALFRLQLVFLDTSEPTARCNAFVVTVFTALSTAVLVRACASMGTPVSAVTTRVPTYTFEEFHSGLWTKNP